jgi:DNA polymerase III alpha subunit (gram-positive type)
MSTAVFFDLETGGLSDIHPNIQLAAVAVDESTWDEIGTFERKIRFPYSAADPQALAMNHYNADVWIKEAVDSYQVCTEFAAFLEPFKCIEFVSKRTGRPYSVAKLIGHNAATFDGPRLKRMFEAHNLFLPADPRVRCTVQAAMWWFDWHNVAPPSYKLSALCEYFGLPVADDAHDALADVRMTVQVARRLRDSRLPVEVSSCA